MYTYNKKEKEIRSIHSMVYRKPRVAHTFQYPPPIWSFSFDWIGRKVQPRPVERLISFKNQSFPTWIRKVNWNGIGARCWPVEFRTTCVILNRRRIWLVGIYIVGKQLLVGSVPKDWQPNGCRHCSRSGGQTRSRPENQRTRRLFSLHASRYTNFFDDDPIHLPIFLVFFPVPNVTRLIYTLNGINNKVISIIEKWEYGTIWRVLDCLYSAILLYRPRPISTR